MGKKCSSVFRIRLWYRPTTREIGPLGRSIRATVACSRVVPGSSNRTWQQGSQHNRAPFAVPSSRLLHLAALARAHNGLETRARGYQVLDLWLLGKTGRRAFSKQLEKPSCARPISSRAIWARIGPPCCRHGTPARIRRPGPTGRGIADPSGRVRRPGLCSVGRLAG